MLLKTLTSSMEEDADMEGNDVDEKVQKSESFDEKLLKDRELFANKLRKLRVQSPSTIMNKWIKNL